MSILQKLFKRGATVDATAQQTDAEPGVRLAEVEAAIAAGEGDVLALLEEREGLQLEVQAAAHARQAREQVEYRAKREATMADFLKRRDAIMRRVGDHVAGLLLALPEVRALMVEAHNVSVPGIPTVEEVLGVPTSFADTMQRAIAGAAPNTQWDFRASSPLGLTSERPKLRGPLTIRLPQFYNAPPIGFSGLWDPVRGEPVS